MPRLVTTTKLRVAPVTRSRGRVPDVSGRFAAPKKRSEPALRYETRRGVPVWPEKKTTTGLCSQHAGRAEKACFVKAVFVGPRAAKRFEVSPGAYVVNCHGASSLPGKIPAHWFPVSDRREAVRVARRFCRCREEGGSPAACARSLGGQPKRRRPR